VPIGLKKSFLGDEQNFLGPLMRLASDDVRDHIFHTKPTTDHRIGATGLCCGRDVKKSTFAEFLVPFDFRHLQQYLPSADIAQLFDDLVGERQQGGAGSQFASSSGPAFNALSAASVTSRRSCTAV
jgi:hypothetical protein